MQVLGLIGLWLTVKVVKEKYKKAVEARDGWHPA